MGHQFKNIAIIFQIAFGCFHSINIPSEWECDVLCEFVRSLGFHSINIPSEWESEWEWLESIDGKLLQFPFN
jgi:hypothetical protein